MNNELKRYKPQWLWLAVT